MPKGAYGYACDTLEYVRTASASTAGQSHRMTVEAWRKWGTAIRIAANGRTEVSCKACERFYWLSERERGWSVCPHCEGWWHLGAATL
jgi:hypothetical protein